MKWPPNWLARRYAKLYERISVRPFDLEQAQGVLHGDSLEARDILRHLEKRGLLYKARQSTDLRRKRYHLISPEQAVLALALSHGTQTIPGKLRAASKDFECVVTGAAAAYRYHGYLTPAKTDALIYKQDLGFWYALFKEKGVELAIDETLAERPGEIVHLHTGLTKEILSRARKIDGIYYTRAEDLVLDLVRKPTERSLQEVLAILLRQSDKLDWALLARSDVRQELGCLMELFNLEADRPAFHRRIIKRFLGTEGVRKTLAVSDKLVTVPEAYTSIAKRWNLQLNVPSTLIRKAVQDLTG